MYFTCYQNNFSEGYILFYVPLTLHSSCIEKTNKVRLELKIHLMTFIKYNQIFLGVLGLKHVVAHNLPITCLFCALLARTQIVRDIKCLFLRPYFIKMPQLLNFNISHKMLQTFVHKSLIL
jgi:hypothetical protein